MRGRLSTPSSSLDENTLAEAATLARARSFVGLLADGDAERVWDLRCGRHHHIYRT
jgi:hypothetical protein